MNADHDVGAGRVGVDSSLIMSIHRTAGSKRSLLDSFNRSLTIPTDGCDFRLLLRGSMVEAYVNGVLVVPFALPNTVSRGGFQQCVTPVTVTVGFSC